jgi:UDPglucose 6-dehydrogenase
MVRTLDRSRRVAVIGSGYVGIVVAACLAHVGHHVTAVEADPARLTALRARRVPFTEAGLEQLVGSRSDQGRLRFSAELDEAIGHSGHRRSATPT